MTRKFDRCCCPPKRECCPPKRECCCKPEKEEVVIFVPIFILGPIYIGCEPEEECCC